MPQICGGPTYGAASVSEKNQRTYKVSYIVEDTTRFGPATALTTVGLPSIGDVWVFDDDIDTFAFCTALTSCEPLTNPAISYRLEYQFQTPEGPTGGCKDHEQAGSPLTAPPRPEIHWDKFTDHAQFDRFGNHLTTSSHEPYSGAQVEYDDARAVITVTQNVANADIAKLSLINNKVNSVPIFGLPPRWVKLTVESLQQKTYGSCYRYYERKLRLEVKQGGWDRYLMDIGTMVLRGFWERNASTHEREWIIIEPVNQKNPADFVRFVDIEGKPMKGVLDGTGRPWVYEPVDNVTDCDFCKKTGGPKIPESTVGVPTQWRLLNIFDSGGASIILEHISGCQWGVEDPEGNTWRLEFSPEGTGTGLVGDFHLYVNPLGTGASAEWIFTDSIWDCFGVNSLTNDAFSAEAPALWQGDASIAPNSDEAVTGCGFCDTPPEPRTLGNQKAGAPSIWRVSELTTAGGETIKLTHTGGCNWDFTDGTDYYLLEFIDEEIEGGPGRYWSLSLNLGTVQWIDHEAVWECQGPNTLTLITDPVPVADPPWPDYVTVVAGNKPGIRCTQFYHAVDFEAILGSLGTL